MTTIVFNADLENTLTKMSLGIGASAIYISNASLSKLSRNFATGTTDATVVGSPVVNADYTKFTGGSNYLETQATDTAQMTIITICRRQVGWSGDAMVMSNNGTVSGDTGIGVSVWLTASGTFAFATARDNGSGSQALASANFTPATPTNWHMLVCESATALTTITSPTTGQTNSSTNTNARYPKTAKMRLGGSYNNSHTGSPEVLITVVVPRILTDDEKTSVIAQLRAYATKHGITV